MNDILLDTYLISLTEKDFLLEGVTPSSVKDIIVAMKNITPDKVEDFMNKYSNKIKSVYNEKDLDKVTEVAEKNGIKKENVTTSKVMLKRALGTILVGIPGTLLAPISLACLIACIIRSIVNHESVLDNVMSIIKEIKNGIKTTRRTNITPMEKAVITAGQASDYLWGVMSSDPFVIIKNFLAFIGMFLAAIFYFWKGIVFAGKTNS